MAQGTPSIIYTTADAARRLHPDLSPRTLERWRLLGRGPRYVKVGRRVAYTEEALATWLQQQERSHTQEEQ